MNTNHKGQSNSKERTFNDFDKLNLKPFAERLLNDIETGMEITSSRGEHGAYTVSLNAEFGNGKTTFLEMFKCFIEDEKNQDYSVFSINVWESDFYKEPIISILSELVNLIKTQKNENDKKENTNKEEIINKIKQILGKIVNYKATKLIGSAVNQAVDKKTGFNVKEIIAASCSKKDKSSNQSDEMTKGQNILIELYQRKEAIKEIKTVISEYKKDKKLLIIIDELDRTRPDYAIHFLEDMKHFFNIENVIFLVAVNRKQMEITVKCLYGENLNFDGYYGKFFKLERDLPEPYREAKRFINDLIQKTNINYDQNDENLIKNLYFSCKIFKLPLREIENFTTIFKPIVNENINLGYIHVICYQFFSCMYFKEKNLFKKVVSGDFTVSNLFEFLEKRNMEILIQKQKNIELIPLLRIIICSLMAKQSEGRDRVICNKKMQDGELFKEKYDDILNEMHDPHRRYGNDYIQFALEICNKIDKYK